MNMNVDPQAPVQPQGWFNRNWKWVLGLGCVLPMLCCGGSVVVAVVATTKLIKSSATYADVGIKVTTDPRVTEALGPPVRFEGLPMGSVNASNGTTHSQLTLKVKGSKLSGTIHVESTQTGAAINYQRLELETEKGDHLDLREGQAEPWPRGPDEPTEPPHDDGPPPRQE